MKKFKLISNKKFIIIINLLLITSLMTVSVYAWFISQVDNRVDAYEITVESDDALEIAFDNEDKTKIVWASTLNLAELKDSDDSYVMDNIKFVEVDGIGADFRIPQLTQKVNYAEVNTSAQWSPAYANQDYLEFTVLMRSKDEMNIYLSSDSFAAPVSTVLTGESCGNPSTFATGANTFSKDCVVGALRVGFKNNAGTDYIWITNPEFHLDNVMGSSEYSMETNAGSKTYNDGGGTEGHGFKWNNPKKHYYYDASNNIKTFANTLSSLPDTVTSVPGNTTLIASLTGSKDAEGFYNDSVTFRVWIEGCDTEARRALVDGKFNLSLVFDTYGFD